jgi:hypothetical protein
MTKTAARCASHRDRALQRLRRLPQLSSAGGRLGSGHASGGGRPALGMPLGPMCWLWCLWWPVGHAMLTFQQRRPEAGRWWRNAVACLSFVANEALYYIALNWLHWHYFWSLPPCWCWWP